MSGCGWKMEDSCTLCGIHRTTCPNTSTIESKQGSMYSILHASFVSFKSTSTCRRNRHPANIFIDSFASQLTEALWTLIIFKPCEYARSSIHLRDSASRALTRFRFECYLLAATCDCCLLRRIFYVLKRTLGPNETLNEFMFP